MTRFVPTTSQFTMDSPILLAQPVIHRLLTYFFAALFIGFVGFGALSTYSRTEPARGEVAATSGFSAIVTEDSGVIAELLVAPGQKVAQGQPLARLRKPEQVGSRGDTTAYALRQMQAALGNIDLQIASNEAAVGALRAQIAELSHNADVSRSIAGRRRHLTAQRQAVAAARAEGLEKLAGEGLVSQQAVDLARVQSLQLMQEAADSELTINEIGRGRDDRVAALESKISELFQASMSLRTERLQTEKQMADLQARQALTIVAPRAGIVVASGIREGQRVEVGQRLFAIAQPSSALTILLEVPSRAIGLIEEGQRVSLKYDAFPYQTFGLRYGRVTRVEPASLEGGRIDSAEQPAADRRFLVEVRPEERTVVAYGRARALKIGMMVTADIEVERRSILAWWLSPILSMKGRFS